VGDRQVEGSDIRRKVLALLCLLIAKPTLAATRDEVIDSLWPDSDPAASLNSLNQTVYFLRRVIEPDYSEATSPGYLGQDGETVWLDPDLVDAQSRRCLDMIRSMPGDSPPEVALDLARAYHGRFALDFTYDEWSSPYRDGLHASYLRVMEHAIRSDLDSGNFARGILLAERAMEVDPEAEEIQLALIRLYRHAGAHAAASEQYGRYEIAMRELGSEPIPYVDL
jgi:DNA-binding SARP family transcriptional activator